ncbi:MAG: cytochrome c maturation protein CcmE [Desulfitobacteriaceae bacterium]|nr:cytochrome c maturation protein CcmE [Desulfitobacteriaceae bacterium]MDD4751727.1 cytochrome c maturation protein CcmE [Desulfitobacteriaceae bacterium]
MKNKKVLISVVVIIAAVYYLMMSGFQNSSVHIGLEQLKTSGSTYRGQYIRTEGTIIGSTVNWDAPNVELAFSVTGKDNPDVILPVIYKNVMPDNFNDATEVMIGGYYTPGESFQAEELVTKCPSKYEEKETAEQEES